MQKTFSPDEDYVITKDNAALLFVRSGYNLPFWEGVNPFTAQANGLTDQQCHWLRENLRAAGNKRKIILMHHPVRSSTGILYADSSNYPVPADEGTFDNNRATFIHICDSNNVDVVLFGHTHHNVVLNKGGYIVDENWTGGTRYIQTAAEMDGNYRIITVNQNFIHVGDPQHVECSDVEPKTAGVSVTLYPNPITNLAMLELHMDENIINYEMHIYNAQGKEVKTVKNINDNYNTIERGNLKEGMYFYTVNNNQGLVKGTGKMNISGN